MRHLSSGWTPIGAAALIAGTIEPDKDTVLPESVVWISDYKTGGHKLQELYSADGSF